MARQDAKLLIRQNPPQRKLQYLLNETYMKIDELKELLRKEATLTGLHIADASVGRMFSRQDYLVTLCAEACIEQERRQAQATASHSHHHSSSTSGHGHSHGARSGSMSHSSIREHPRDKGDKVDDSKLDGSWYGSLDRSLAKKKKHQLIDKRRRHTKTIGSMAGLDVIKKSSELKPDEQYEIGLPAAPKVTSSRSSIFPMTQHQYYTALMESKMTKKSTYPLEVRQPPLPPQYPTGMMQRPVSTWGYYVENLVDENKNMRKQMEVVHHHHQPPPPPPAPVHLTKPNLVPLPARSLGNELAFIHPHSHSARSSKKWYETNLDEAGTTTPVTTQNSSPSPSMLSSTRGSSRGSVASGIDTIDGNIACMTISSPANESTEFTSKSSESSESWSGTGNEVTKPFEMSDYYKYSTKFRSRNSPVSEDANQHEPRSPNGMSGPPSIIHSRHPSQVRQASFDGTNGLRETNGNPSVGPKLPPKQRRNQNKSMGSSSVIFEGDIVNGDPTKEVWMTNEPTFV